MATLGDKDQIDILLNVDGKNSKKTLTEINKLVKALSKNAEEAEDKLSRAGKQMNKLFATTKVQYNQILKQKGLGSIQQQGIIQDIRKAEKDLASHIYASPFRTTAQAFSTNEKILADAGKSMANSFAQNLKSFLAGNKGAYSFDASNYMRSAEYRKMVNKGFSHVEKELAAELASGKDVKSQMNALLDLKDKDVAATEKQIAAQEKLKNLSTGALALIQTRLIANYTIINSVMNAFSYLTKYVIEFDQEIKNLQAIINVSDAGLEKLKDSIIDVANSTKFTSLELTKTAVVLGQAGLSIQQIKDTLGPIAKLATATGTDLATSTQTITSALNIYNLQADEAAYITNALTTAMNESKAEIRGFQYSLQYAGNTAANLGVSFEETAAATAALAQSGIKSVSTQGTGLRAIFTELIKPTQKFKDQLAKVGLTTADVDVKTKGFIPVLKTLKEAGFGVTEAYRGMERRGAAAMVAILNQTEFMDDLTEKMSLSTAGAKANETQMKGLANTFKNTQSIMGSLVYDGFEPLIGATQQLLEGFNNLVKDSGLAKFVAFAVTLGSSAVGIALVVKSIASMVNALKIASNFKVVGTIFGALAGASTLKITAVVAAFTGLAAVIGKLAETFNWFGAGYDKALSGLEDEQGKLSKAEESYNAFSSVVAKAFTQREKFAGPEGQRELDKFVNMIRTRFPQISSYLEKPINSFEELTEVLMKASIAMSGFVATATNGTPVAARSLVNQASKTHYGEKGEEGLKADLRLLRKSGVITRGDIGKGAFSNLFSSGAVLADALRSGYNRDPKETERVIRALLSDASKEIGEELRTVLESFLKETEVNSKARYTQIDNILNQRLGLTAFGNLGNSSATLNSMRASYGNMLSEGLTHKGISGLLAQAEGNYKYLTEGSSLRNIVTSQLSSDDLNRIAKETNSTTEQVIERGIVYLRNLYAETAAGYLNFIEELSKKVEDGEKAYSDATLQETNRRFNNIVKNLKNTSQNELDRKQQEALGIAERTRKLKIAELDKELENGKIFKEMYDQQVADINDAYDEQVDRIKGEVASVKENFARVAKSQSDYFESISTAIATVDSLYERSKIAIEGGHAGAEGRITAYGATGATNAQTAAEYRLGQNRITDYARYYAAALQARSGYQSQLDNINGVASRDSLAAVVARTKAELDRLASSGDATSKQLIDAEKAYSDAVSEQKKYTDLTDSLNEKIADLDKEITSLDTTIKQLNYQYGSDDVGGAFSKSFGTAGDMYAKENRYMNSGLNQWTEEMFSSTWYSGLSEAENALANFFDTAISGASSTGDAFRDMCKSILDAMTQALYSEIAKQFISLIFGSSQTPKGQMSGRSLILQSFKTGFSSLFGGSNVLTTVNSSPSGSLANVSWTNASYMGPMSHGGLVTGGIANRDSVGASLMPGEYVMRKSAVDALGTDFLARLNSGNTDIISAAGNTMKQEGDTGPKGKSSTLNIWVVSPDQVPPENSENIIMTVSRDIQTNGSIKKLIKQVSMGAL